MTDKLALRARLRARRDAFAPSAPVVVPTVFVKALHVGPIVAAYRPVGSEADPAPFVAAARRAGCRLALPHVTSRAEPIRFLAWDEAAPLVPGPFGLQQPPADAAVLHPDIILTPLLGFDAACNRLGQGAGHYDRAFAEHPDAWRIGIAWSAQRLDTIAIDSWDVPLHAVATEKDWILPMRPRP